MDLMTSPTAISTLPRTDSRGDREEQAGLVLSHGISVQTDSHSTAHRPAAHRPAAIKHVYNLLDTPTMRVQSDIPFAGQHPHTIALCDITSAVIPLRVK